MKLINNKLISILTPEQLYIYNKWLYNHHDQILNSI